jgi:xanthine dehydrogenase accessory factor
MAVRDALVQNAEVFLVTVLETWGASPRPVGSLMAFVPSENKVFGSLSGGCIEQDLLESLLLQGDQHRLEAYPCIKSYGEDLSGYALPCGASLSLSLEFLSPANTNVAYEVDDKSVSSLEQISYLLAGLDRGESFIRTLDFESGRASLASHSEHPNSFTVWHKGNRMSHTFHSPEELLIVGLGDVTRYLVPLAQSIGYRVTICEPREDILARQVFEGSCALITDMLPDDLVFKSFMSSSCAIVALAHDPRVDDLALIASLQGDAHFVGALGSSKTSHSRRLRLQALGLNEEQLSRLNAPIGVDINSRTPAEIAIAIAAKLVSERASALTYSLPKSITNRSASDA